MAGHFARPLLKKEVRTTGRDGHGLPAETIYDRDQDGEIVCVVCGHPIARVGRTGGAFRHKEKQPHA